LGVHALQGEDPYRWFGLGRYVRELALSLVREHRDVVAGLEVDAALAMPGGVEDFAGRGLLHQWPHYVRDLAHQYEFRIYHVMSPFSPFPAHRLFPPAFARAGARLAVTLHDLIPWIYPETYMIQISVKGWYRARLKLVQAADLVIAVSESAAEDAVRLLGIDPDRIHVTHEAASEVFQRSDRPADTLLAQVRAKFPAITGSFIVYGAGAADPRKNVDGLIRAFAAVPQWVRRDYQLVITGGTPAARQEGLMRLGSEAGVAERIVFFGFVSDETLRDLYRACALSVFPSFYEGFGLPVLEAMASGAPVVVSDRASLPELVELPRARFDPDRPDDIARVMTDALTDAGFNAELRDYSRRRVGEFSWSRTAQATVDAYEWLASTQGSRVRAERRRPSIAACGRVDAGAPDVHRIAKRLAERYDATVDIVVEKAVGSPNGGLAVRCVNAVQFRSAGALAHYDAVLYVLDGSEADSYLLEPIRKQPGVVWLKSVSLLRMYRAWYETQGYDLATLPPDLDQWTSRYPDPKRGLLLRDEETQRRDALYMLGEVTSQATQIIVGSQAEREIAMLENTGSGSIKLVPRGGWGDEDVIDSVCRILLGEPARELVTA
jgi:glycosyltransferase involved in cell wall biosynthesis